MAFDRNSDVTPYPDYIDPYQYSWNFYPSVAEGNPYGFEGYYRDQKKNSPYGDLDTNSWNLYLNERQNYLNLAQWQAQNAFNLDMWNLNNQYNSPSQQVDRLIQAGINPVQSLSSAPSGNAQVLKSDSPNSFDPIANTGVQESLAQDYAKFVQSNSLNATLGLGKLNIEQQKADVAAKVGDSQVTRNQKEADYLSNMAEGKRLSNQWDLESFDVRLDEEGEKLREIQVKIDEIKSQKDLNEEQVKELQSLEAKYDAEKDLARERINDIQASIKQRDEQLKINWFNAHSNRVSSNAQFQQAKTFADTLEFRKIELHSEVQKWNNDQLLTYMRDFANEFQVKGKGRLGTRNNYVEGSGSWQGRFAPEGFPLKPIVVCEELVDRSSKNPSEQSLKHAAEADRLIKALAKAYNIKNGNIPNIIPNASPRDLHFTPDATSVANPVFGLDNGDW